MIAILSMIYHYASTAMFVIPKSMLTLKGNFLTMIYLETMAHNIKIKIIAIYKLIIYYLITIYI